MNNIFNAELLDGALKIAFVVAAFFNLVYIFIVSRQINLMKKTLITGFSSSVSLLGLINLLLALTVFVGFLLFL
ncbi:hypothetical protein KKI22_00540 [Patescibacteria group bacterium]|nr:hypothetical protein [Patescibacteria group bacterium]